MWLIRFLFGAVFILASAITGYTANVMANLHPGMNIVWIMVLVSAACFANGVLFIVLSCKREQA